MSNQQVQKLTPQEKEKLEVEKEMFVLIRHLDLVEKLFSFDKISDNDYNQIVEKSLEKYNKFKNQIKNFQLNDFLKVNGLEGCTWAQERIDKGTGKTEQKTWLFVQLTNQFHKTLQIAEVNEAKPSVSQLKPLYDDLMELLSKCMNYLGQQYTQHRELQELGKKIWTGKSVVDILSETEYEEFKYLVEQAFNSFNKIQQR